VAQGSQRAVALRALRVMGIGSPKLRLVLDLHNTTFEVRAGTQRFALRIGRPDSTRAAVEAEAAWIRSLDEDTDLRLGVPEGLEEVSGRVCLLTRWVEGRLLKKRVSPDTMATVGEAMAVLHDHGEHWTPPAGWHRPALGDIWLGRPDPLERLPAAARDVLGACVDWVDAMLGFLQDGPHFVLHADLHQSNVRFATGGSIGIFDFDDCAVGHPAMDVAISRYDRLRHTQRKALYDGFEEGYRRRRPWTYDEEVLETLQVWRMLSLCAVLHAHANPTMRGYIPMLLPRWVEHGRAFLDARGG